MPSESETDEEKLDAVINALKADDVGSESDSQSEPAEEVVVNVSTDAKPQRGQRGGPPMGPPPSRKLPVPSALPGPPSTKAPRAAISVTKPAPDAYENTNKLYYSKFEDEHTDLLGAMFALSDNPWAQRAIKALFCGAVVGAVGFGFGAFTRGVANWHLACDMAIDLTLVVLGLLMVALAGIACLLVATSGNTRYLLSWAALAVFTSYFTTLCLATALVTDGFSEQYNFTCNAYGTRDNAIGTVEASWAFMCCVIFAKVFQFGAQRVAARVENTNFSRLKLSDMRM